MHHLSFVRKKERVVKNERQIWFSLPIGQKPEENPRIAAYLEAGWSIADSQQHRVLPETRESRLWVVLLKKRMVGCGKDEGKR